MEIKTKKSTQKTEKKSEVRDINVTRAHAFEDGTIAFDMDVNGVSIYNCTLREGKNGMFVSFPSRKAKDGKYYSYVYVTLSADHVNAIVEQIEKM